MFFFDGARVQTQISGSETDVIWGSKQTAGCQDGEEGENNICK